MRRWLPLVLVVLAGGCPTTARDGAAGNGDSSTNGGVEQDAGLDDEDGGPGGEPDAGGSDLDGGVDAGPPDAGSPDAGPPDAGITAPDGDDDGVPDQSDRCSVGSDTDDADGDGLPDACDPCADGEASCPWPAEAVLDAENLTVIEDNLLSSEFREDLSGGTWDDVHERLWVCRNTASESKIWSVVRGGAGFEIETRDGARSEWADFGDLEGMTLRSLDEPFRLFLIVEVTGSIVEVDLSVPGEAAQVNEWVIADALPSANGPEGLTFVPDAVLAAQGFVDGSGAAFQSSGGLGGIFLVAHQNGGHLYAFDLNRDDSGWSLVGDYTSARTESAGLELDRQSGLLFILHGGSFNEVEIARLSSTADGDVRRFDTVHIYEGPPTPPLLGDNYEGIALGPAPQDCAQGRDFFLTVDGGNGHSLLRFGAFPCF